MTAGDRHTLSACMIVRDEARLLPFALNSVAFCHEIIVVDSGSKDGTAELARDAGALVFERSWPGFGAQRNAAIDQATSDWILEIDADETITPELAVEITSFLATPGPRDTVDVLAIPMRHRFLGAELGPSMQYPNYRTRMFRRGVYRHDESRTVHEGLKPRGATLALRGDMTHLLADSWREALRDVWRYTELEAGQFRPPITPGRVLVGLVGRPATKALYRLVLDGAWRDGWRGLAKVGLDCGSDAVVWARVLRRREAGRDKHFGEVMPAAGPPRIVALATTEAGARRAATWLAAAVAAGAGTDCELATPTVVPADGFFVRATPSGGPLDIARAVTASAQVRTVDALLLADPGARRAHRWLPHRTRANAGPLKLDDPPAATVARLARELR